MADFSSFRRPRVLAVFLAFALTMAGLSWMFLTKPPSGQEMLELHYQERIKEFGLATNSQCSTVELDATRFIRKQVEPFLPETEKSVDLRNDAKQLAERSKAFYELAAHCEQYARVLVMHGKPVPFSLPRSDVSTYLLSLAITLDKVVLEATCCPKGLKRTLRISADRVLGKVQPFDPDCPPSPHQSAIAASGLESAQTATQRPGNQAVCLQQGQKAQPSR